MLLFFFFQAEDGIRDRNVTGVQTCALPIYRLVIDGGRETAAVAHRAQDQKIADRLRHPDAGGEGVRVLPARRVLLARFPGLYHRRAARSLHDNHARPLLADPAQRLQFGESLPHADNAGAAAGRIKDDVGHFPAELLGQLDAHRLLALDTVGLAQRRAIEPANALLALGDELAAIVDQPVDEVDRRTLHRDLTHVHRRQIGRAHV